MEKYGFVYIWYDVKHKKALRGIKKKPHTDEWKEENSKRMKDQWSDPNNERRKKVSEATKKRWEEFRKQKELNTNVRPHKQGGE